MIIWSRLHQVCHSLCIVMTMTIDRPTPLRSVGQGGGGMGQGTRPGLPFSLDQYNLNGSILVLNLRLDP